MVQVDIFWSFAVGAGFATCASTGLENEEKPFESRAFIMNLLWLSIFFVPSGAVLLWGFPAWETMQVGTYETIPAWLVALFCGTNVTQGILGFWIAYKLIRAKKTYLAHLMWIVGYFLMLFVLVHGWDGTGYQRFLYCAKDWAGNITPWQPGTFSFTDPMRFFFSPVAATLGAMGVILMPFLMKWMAQLQKEAHQMIESTDTDSRDRIVPLSVSMNLIVIEIMGSVIIASLLIHLLGWILGIGVFGGLAYFLFREGGHVHRKMFPSGTHEEGTSEILSPENA